MDTGLQSSSVKSYVSAIRAILKELKVQLTPENYLITSLTKACRLKNDVVEHQFPIHKGILKLMLKQLEIIYTSSSSNQQPYLEALFKAMYVSAYFGMLRITEVAKSQHSILAQNVHIGQNKKKILFVLLSSKPHGHGDKPQKVKISSMPIQSTHRKNPDFGG